MSHPTRPELSMFATRRGYRFREWGSFFGVSFEMALQITAVSDAEAPPTPVIVLDMTDGQSLD